MWVLRELGDKRFLWDELRRDAGKVVGEECRDVGSRVGGEEVEDGLGGEEGACEGLVERWEGDEHEVAARPDVQAVR